MCILCRLQDLVHARNNHALHTSSWTDLRLLARWAQGHDHRAEHVLACQGTTRVLTDGPLFRVPMQGEHRERGSQGTHTTRLHAAPACARPSWQALCAPWRQWEGRTTRWPPAACIPCCARPRHLSICRTSSNCPHRTSRRLGSDTWSVEHFASGVRELRD